MKRIYGVVIMLIVPAVIFSQRAFHSVLITEILADPTPAVKLPAYEFIELKNVTKNAIDLFNWRIADSKDDALIKVHYVLQPDSFLIICSNAAYNIFNLYGPTIGVSNFPSLDNDGELIYLLNDLGSVIHAVAFEKSWLRNQLKEDGGWSLEMIDIGNPCGGKQNWIASVDDRGGTPGTENSVSGSAPDEQPPALIASYFIDNSSMMIAFDEPMDSSSVAVASKYKLEHSTLYVTTATALPPLFNQVRLALADTVDSYLIYRLNVSGVYDCAGNSIGIKNTVNTGRSHPPKTGDIVINEILFHPKTGSKEFIELYNKGETIVEAGNLFFANRSATATLSNIKNSGLANHLFFPNSYLVVSTDSFQLTKDFTIKDPDAVRQVASLPSLSDDEGSLVILDEQGMVVDELAYSKDWHFPLIQNAAGVSLERIDPNGPTQNKNNWTSAASTAGYGTPGYVNSQYRSDLQVKGTITINPPVFSPDNDGNDDFLTINYELPEPSTMASMTIYDATGRPVRYLVKNELLGISGKIKWDGLNEQRSMLPVGHYVMFCELFNLQGKTKKFRIPLTLVRRT
jgi:hypothetical protein